MQTQVDTHSTKEGAAGLQSEDTSAFKRPPYSWSSYLSSNSVLFHVPNYGKQSCDAPQLKQGSFTGVSTPDVEKGLHEVDLGMSDHVSLLQIRTDKLLLSASIDLAVKMSHTTAEYYVRYRKRNTRYPPT